MKEVVVLALAALVALCNGFSFQVEAGVEQCKRWCLELLFYFCLKCSTSIVSDIHGNLFVIICLLYSFEKKKKSDVQKSTNNFVIRSYSNSLSNSIQCIRLNNLFKLFLIFFHDVAFFFLVLFQQEFVFQLKLPILFFFLD